MEEPEESEDASGALDALLVGAGPESPPPLVAKPTLGEGAGSPELEEVGVGELLPALWPSPREGRICSVLGAELVAPRGTEVELRMGSGVAERSVPKAQADPTTTTRHSSKADPASARRVGDSRMVAPLSLGRLGFCPPPHENPPGECLSTLKGGGAPLIRLRPQEDLDLEATLYSGQAFRWVRAGNGGHEGWIDNQPALVRKTGSRLQWEAPNALRESRVRHYFRLDASHEEFLRSLPAEPYVKAAVGRFPGLRLLRQDPWEMLVSFLVSQNSNEAKIRRTVEALCRLASPPLEWRARSWHPFPSPSALAGLSEPQLRSTGLGYRAPFLWAAARLVLAGRLDPWSLGALPYAEAFRRLLAVPGIGVKVADCILLYGCDHRAAFPTDVWVKRFLRETYRRRGASLTHERVLAFAERRFGPQAGYAQHFLFHYRRAVGALRASPA